MREGMTTLVRKLREMTEAGTVDYTLAGVTYWTDDELQDVLDENRARIAEVQLRPRPDYISGLHVYKRFEIPWVVQQVEGTASGTDNFRLSDATGDDLALPFTFSERDLSVVFTADQEGSARYWSGFSYDLRKAAIEIWMRKAAHSWTAINFTADGHRFEREALHAHCMAMAKSLGYQSGAKASRMIRSDLSGVPSDGDKF